MTIGPPLLNQNHRRTRTIAGSHPSRERKEERTEFGERVVRIKTVFIQIERVMDLERTKKKKYKIRVGVLC